MECSCQGRREGVLSVPLVCPSPPDARSRGQLLRGHETQGAAGAAGVVPGAPRLTEVGLLISPWKTSYISIFATPGIYMRFGISSRTDILRYYFYMIVFFFFFMAVELFQEMKGYYRVVPRKYVIICFFASISLKTTRSRSLIMATQWPASWRIIIPLRHLF